MSNFNPHYLAASPLGPASGGFMPSLAQMQMADMNRNLAVAQSANLAYDDPRTKLFVRMAGRTLYGDRPLTPNEQKSLSLMVGTAVNSGFFGGGSTTNLLAAAQNAAAASTAVEGSGGAFGVTAGMGPLSMAAGGLSAQSMMRYFINDGGAQRLNRTYGLGRDGLAGLMTLSSARGLVGPTQIETYGVARDGMTRADTIRQEVAQLQTRLKQQTSAGQTELAGSTQDLIKRLEESINTGTGALFGLDPQFEERMNKTVEKGAKALAAVKNIFGNKSWMELADNLEAVTGLKVGGGTDFGQLEEKFRQIQSKIEASGQDVGGVMSAVVEATRAAGGGLAGSIAGRAALIANTDLAAAARNNGLTGYDARRAAKELELGISSSMSESMSGLGEVAALLNTGSLTGAQADEAQKLISEFGGARSLEDRIRANNALMDFQSRMGYVPGSMTSELGADAVGKMGGNVLIDAAANSERSLTASVTARDAFSAIYGNNRDQASAFTDLAQKHSAATIEKVQGMLRSGDMAGVRSLVGADAASALEAAFGGKTERMNLGLTMLRNGVPGASGFISDEDRIRIQAGANARETLRALLPDQFTNMAPLGFGEQLLQGISGGLGDLSDSQLANLAGSAKELGVGNGVLRLGMLGQNAAGKMTLSGLDDATRKAIGAMPGGAELLELISSGKESDLTEFFKRTSGRIGMGNDGNITLLSDSGMKFMRSKAAGIGEAGKKLVESDAFLSLNTDTQSELLNSLSSRAISGVSSAKLSEDFIALAKEKAKDPANRAEGAAQYLGELKMVVGNEARLALSRVGGTTP